ncbi:MAG: hypothetical protein HYR76_07970 [Ignavibacteria bacterium]|nr:hypothetical protein [Ignavibacteria bacterium]
MYSIKSYFLLAALTLATLAVQTPAIAQEENESHENPAERAKLRFLQRVDNNGRIRPNALIDAKKEIDEMRARQARRIKNNIYEVSDAGLWNWEWLGPGNIGGRIRAILIHPTNPSTMWIGSVSGGIWRSDNAGGSWYPSADFMKNLAVTSLVMDPTDVNVMYASTGEAFLTTDGLQGAGIFKSLDGGATWNQLSSTSGMNFQNTNRLAHHPTAANTLLAATSASQIFRSTDGGDSWTSVLSTIGIATDVKYHPLFPNNVLAGTASDAYFSSDAGVTWTRQTTGAPGKLPLGRGRCEVAFAPSTGATMYIADTANGGEVWSGTAGAGIWTRMNTGTNYMVGSSNQGQYDNAIWVDPTDPNTIVVGGIDLWRSTDGGTTLTRISQWQNFHNGGPANSAHADQHVIINHPGYNGSTNRIVYFGNDGGIQRATDVLTVAPTTGWTNLATNLGITQFYGGSAAPNGSLIVGGAQDNDKLHFTPANGIHNWRQPSTGDGGFAAIDYINNNLVYGEYTNLGFLRSDNGGGSYAPKVNGLGDANNANLALFISPFSMDPNTPTTLVAGGRSIWQTLNAGDNWTRIRVPTADGQRCSAIDIAQGNSSNIWVGYDIGRVSRTFDGGGLWLDAAGLPARYVTDIAINPSNNAEVVVTFGSYANDCVWMTTNGGLNWAKRTGTGIDTLPAIQVNTVRYHPLNTNWLYVGTDLGIFASEDKGLTWNITPHFAGNHGPVNVEVDELFWQGTDYLIAATHGRGMFRSRPRVAVYVNLENLNPGDGTPENPYRLLQDGINAQGNGTPLFIKSGTYQQGSLIFDRRGQLIPQNGAVIIR